MTQNPDALPRKCGTMLSGKSDFATDAVEDELTANLFGIQCDLWDSRS